MKKYIRSSDVLSATKYKSNDPRLPLIQSIQDVLGLEFQGNRSDMQYSDKYKCYLEYSIFSGSQIGNGLYKMVIYQSDEPKRQLGETANGYGNITADPEIMKDVEEFIKTNYPDLHIKTNIKYGFIVVKQYMLNKSAEKDASKIFRQVRDILNSMEEMDDIEVSGYKPYDEYVSVTVMINLFNDEDKLKQKVSVIRDTLLHNGFSIKSISITKGRAKYPAYWFNHRVTININYN